MANRLVDIEQELRQQPFVRLPRTKPSPATPRMAGQGARLAAARASALSVASGGRGLLLRLSGASGGFARSLEDGDPGSGAPLEPDPGSSEAVLPGKVIFISPSGSHLTCSAPVQHSSAFMVPAGVRRITVAGTVQPTGSCDDRTTVFVNVVQKLLAPGQLGSSAVTAQGTNSTPFSFSFGVAPNTEYRVLIGISGCKNDCMVYYDFSAQSG